MPSQPLLHLYYSQEQAEQQVYMQNSGLIATTHQEKGPFNQRKRILYKYFLMTNGKNTYINTKTPSQHSYLWNHEFTSSTQLNNQPSLQPSPGEHPPLVTKGGSYRHPAIFWLYKHSPSWLSEGYGTPILTYKFTNLPFFPSQALFFQLYIMNFSVKK